MLTDEERTRYGIEKGEVRERQYLSKQDYAAVREHIDRTRWIEVLHNKMLTANYFADTHLAIPETFGYLEAFGGETRDGVPLRSAGHLAAWARTSGIDSFALKHIGEGGARSIFMIESVGKRSFRTADGGHLSFEDLDTALSTESGGLTGFIVQQRLHPHPWIRVVSGDARSSFRVNTLRKPDGDALVQFAVMRLGLADRMSDNYQFGAVYAPVNLETGEVGRGLVQVEGEDVWVDAHPQTGAPLAGEIVPGFGAVVECARSAAEMTPGVRTVGWDIVLSEAGPVMIEGNIGWDIVLLQLLLGGWRGNGVAGAWAEHWGFKLPTGHV